MSSSDAAADHSDMDPQADGPAPSSPESSRRAWRRLALPAGVALVVAVIAGWYVFVAERDGDSRPGAAREAAGELADGATGWQIELDQAAVRPLAPPPWSPGDSQLAQLGPALDDPDFGRSARPSDASRQQPAVVPLERRWQIVFPSGLTDGEYARSIDALGIELGVLLDDGQIQYVSQLSQGSPQKRTGPLQDERRLYFTWDRGDLIEADRLLLANQRVSVGDRIVLHFCPEESVARLKKLEHEYRQRAPAEIALTRFSVKRTFRGYEVFVTEQREQGHAESS